MSSITTSIPTGPIGDWCVGSLSYGCGDSERGQKDDGWQSFCCNGMIINAAKDLWQRTTWDDYSDRSLDLADMVCCGENEPKGGGIQPIPTAYTTCNDGKPTPLASLAGTNVANAQNYWATYKSASYGDNTVADWTRTETPFCFWAYTPTMSMEEITLPTPDITSILARSGDGFSAPFRVSSGAQTTGSSPVTTTMDSSSVDSSSTPSSSTPNSSTPSSSTDSSPTDSSSTPSETGDASPNTNAASSFAGVRKGYLCFGLGVVTMSLLWS